MRNALKRNCPNPLMHVLTFTGYARRETSEAALAKPGRGGNEKRA